MKRWNRKGTRTLRHRSHKLHLECLEPRLCLSTYTTVDLIPLAGHNSAKAFGLNDNGLAVGSSHLVGDSRQDAAVVWSIDPAGEALPFVLPGIDGAASIHAVDVNNQGMIVGESWIPENTSGDHYAHAGVWTGDHGSYIVNDLGTLAYLDTPEETTYENFLYSSAQSVSEPDIHGNVWVVGTSANVSADPQIHRGVLWQIDPAGNVLSMTDLEPSSDNVDANDVKVIGGSVFVVGDFVPESPVVQACIWETDLSGSVVGRTDLGTAAFVSLFQGTALNSDGDVAGTGYNSALERNGFLYENSDDSITDLGSLGNEGSYAWGINDSDVVVGKYLNVKPQGFYTVEERAFVWENGTMHDLLDQVSDRTFWLLFSANDVNDNGEIVGNGRAGKRNDSQEHGFLARPEDAADQHPPVATDDIYTTHPETTLSVAAPGVLGNDTDVDGDPMTAALDAGPTSGTLALNADGSFTYTPSSGFTGTDSFTYVANDGVADSNEATVTITVDAVDPPEIGISNVSKREGRTGKETPFTFTVTRTGDTSQDLTVYYATADGTGPGAATGGDDYLATSGSLVFGAGETTKTITVTIKGDSTREDDEFFFVRLSLTDDDLNVIATAVGTIINDDK